MFGIIRLVWLLVPLSLTLWGCGGAPHLLKELPTTINTLRYAKTAIKIVPAALVEAPDTPLGRDVAALYFTTLVEAIGNEDGRSKLLTPRSSDFPSYLKTPDQGAAAGLSEKSRNAGHQGFVLASVNDIRTVAKKTGIFWFRKIRHFINYTVTVDLYDPYTAAKIVNEVVEGTIKISENDYDAYLAGTAVSISALNKEIGEVAGDLGKIIGGALKDQQWRAAVAGIEDNRIVIPAGRYNGLEEGDRLAVFGGRRVLQGIAGALYFAPGVQVGEIQITSVSDGIAEAKALTSNGIQPGDIVVPLK